MKHITHLGGDGRVWAVDGDEERPCSPECVEAIAYLGGPMRGLPYWNFPAFDAAQKALEELGWTIHSPAEHDRSMGLVPVEDGTVTFPVSACLDWDFARIAESSCVIVLPGWETSTGCHWEFTVAYALGKPVFQYPELTPVELPDVVTTPVWAQDIVGLYRAAMPSPEVRAQAERRLARRGHVVPPAWGSADIWREGFPGPYAEERSVAHVRGVDGPGAWSYTPDQAAVAGINLAREHNAEVRIVDAKTAENVYEDSLPQSWAPRAGEICVVDPQTGGAKGSKPERFDLIPADVMEELARHYGRGCLKYADRNWEKGYKWSLSLAALERHLNLWKQRQDIDHDPEVGDFPHLVAVIWHACALLAFAKREIGTDDRA